MLKLNIPNLYKWLTLSGFWAKTKSRIPSDTIRKTWFKEEAEFVTIKSLETS